MVKAESHNNAYVYQAGSASAWFSPAERGRFWAKVERGPEDACWLWRGSRIPEGYGQLTISRFSRAPLKAHRVAFALTHGVWPTGYVLHSCDTPACVNPNHLRVGTPAENMADCLARHPTGPGVPQKLDVAAVAHLHALCDRGLPHTHIGRMLGVSNTTVARYRRKYAVTEATVNRHVANTKQAGRR